MFSFSTESNMFTKIIYRIRPAFLADFLKKIFNLKRIKFDTTRGIFLIDPVSNFGRALLDEGDYEKDLTNKIIKSLNAGDIFLDIGANEGWFTIISSKIVGPTGYVYSIEPQSRLKTTLIQNMKSNNCTNVYISDAILSSHNGYSEIFIAPSTNSGSSGLYNLLSYSTKKELCVSYTLKRYLQMIGKTMVDVAKVDIEGGEWELISSSADILSKGAIQHLYLEVHPHILMKLGHTANELEELLKSFKYSITKNGDSWFCRYEN